MKPKPCCPTSLHASWRHSDCQDAAVYGRRAVHDQHPGREWGDTAARCSTKSSCSHEALIVTKQLIDARCHVDLPEKDGTTPLFMAAQEGHVAVTMQLIEARCNVDLQVKDGRTPLSSRPFMDMYPSLSS
jgi:ankyrin repeat protein